MALHQRTNRRNLIVQTATDLFIKGGYAATSVRQIADAVGCTEAALYYHFKEGKRALLQAVVENETPDFMNVLESCRQANSLSELIHTYIRSMCMHCTKRERHIQWLISELPNFSADERSIFAGKHLMFHAELVKLIVPFVKNQDEANELGWMLICASFGYRQIFVTLGLDDLTDFSIHKFADSAAHYLAE